MVKFMFITTLILPTLLQCIPAVFISATVFSVWYIRGNVGILSWPILKNHLSGVITVSEEEIISAMRTVSPHTNQDIIVNVLGAIL